MVENALDTFLPAIDTATMAMMAISTTSKAYSTMLAPSSVADQAFSFVQRASKSAFLSLIDPKYR